MLEIASGILQGYAIAFGIAVGVAAFKNSLINDVGPVDLILLLWRCQVRKVG